MPKTNTAPKTNGQHSAATSADAAERERYEAMIREAVPELRTPADAAPPLEGTVADYAAPFAAPELPDDVDPEDLNRRLANIAPSAEARRALITCGNTPEPADAPPFTRGVYAWMLAWWGGGAFVLKNARVSVRATREHERQPPRLDVTGAVTRQDGRLYIRRRCWLTGSVFDLPADAPCPVIEADVYGDSGERLHDEEGFVTDQYTIHPELLKGGPQAFAERLPRLFHGMLDELAQALGEAYKMRSLVGQQIRGGWPAGAWNALEGQEAHGEEGPTWKDTGMNATLF